MYPKRFQTLSSGKARASSQPQEAMAELKLIAFGGTDSSAMSRKSSSAMSGRWRQLLIITL